MERPESPDPLTPRPLPVEILAMWLLFVFVGGEILVTYTRTPAAELYYVTGSGFGLAVHTALLFVGFPVGLIAVAIAGVVADRIPGRVTLAATFAVAAFGVVAFVTGGAEETEVEVRAVSALAILGVAIAAALTVTSARHGGVARIHRSIPGDRVRVGIAILIGLVSIPWLAADLGIAVDQIPVFNRIFISEAVAPDPGHPKPFSAVHDGHHHGMDGVLIVWSALLLTRLLPDVGGKRLRAFLSPYVALMLVFGLANAIQDFWTEQLFKRAVVSWDMPRFTRVTADPHWIVLLVIAVTAYTLAIRPGALLGRARVPATV